MPKRLPHCQAQDVRPSGPTIDTARLRISPPPRVTDSLPSSAPVTREEAWRTAGPRMPDRLDQMVIEHVTSRSAQPVALRPVVLDLHRVPETLPRQLLRSEPEGMKGDLSQDASRNRSGRRLPSGAADMTTLTTLLLLYPYSTIRRWSGSRKDQCDSY